MAKDDQGNAIPDRMHIRFCLRDGRTNTLLAWSDGEWKVEIFGSKEHAIRFAKAHNMEVIDHDDSESQEC
jgi:hypothetical protein